jgi:hypothetical protein
MRFYPSKTACKLAILTQVCIVFIYLMRLRSIPFAMHMSNAESVVSREQLSENNTDVMPVGDSEFKMETNKSSAGKFTNPNDKSSRNEQNANTQPRTHQEMTGTTHVEMVEIVPKEKTFTDFNKDTEEKTRLTPSKSVVNPHPFTFMNTPRYRCSDINDLTVFILVHSALRHFNYRNIIRKTWGNSSRYTAEIRVGFVLGITPTEPALQEQIDQESTEYGDIIQEDFVDAYRNMTYKSICGFRWATTFCDNAKYIVKTDDDVLIDMFLLLKMLRSNDNSTSWKAPKEGFLMCQVYSKVKVRREGKWKTSVEEYPNATYPNYCPGMGYVMTPDVTKAFYLASYNVPFFWIDDVYITGTLASKLSIKHVDIRHVPKPKVDSTIATSHQLKVFEHFGKKPEQFESAWDSL